MGPQMEPKRDRKRVAKGTRNGTETEILLNTNHEESSYATTRKDREDSGLFLGVQVEERELEAELELGTRTHNSNPNSMIELDYRRSQLGLEIQAWLSFRCTSSQVTVGGLPHVHGVPDTGPVTQI